MVLIEVVGTLVSGSRVVFNTLKNSIHQAVATNAPNGNIFQKFAGAVFGVQITTRMTPPEALNVLGFEQNDRPDIRSIKQKLDQSIGLNDLSKGGSPYLNEKFIAAAHILKDYKPK